MMPPSQRTFYALQPNLPLGEWWQQSLFVLAILGFFAFVVWMYRRDSVELPRGITFLLTALRIFVLFLLALFVLNPQLRSETRFSKNSRLAVLVDTSLSMGLKDGLNIEGSSESQPRRIDRVIDSLSSQSTLSDLRLEHDITIYRFGDTSRAEEVTSLTKIRKLEPRSERSRTQSETELQLRRSKLLAYAAYVLFAATVGFGITWWNFWSRLGLSNRAAWFAALSILSLVGGTVFLSLADLNTPGLELQQSLGWRQPSVPGQSAATEESILAATPADVTPIDWRESLTPTGTSTKLGNAIQSIVSKERGGPIAGVVVFSDGRNNSGVEPSRAIGAASNAGIPIYTVGVGSSKAPRNVQVADIQVPTRVFPDDKFQVKGLVQAFGLDGQTIRVELISIDEKETEAETLEGETTIRLAADGQSVPVVFDIHQQEQGKRRYIIRASPVEGELDLRDNQRGAQVEVVDRKTNVLLIAGGPTREFRFLRNQLFRDKDIVLHVWLQTAKSGAAQEADKLLFEFPRQSRDVFEYDCIIAFDPDWRELDADQAATLERWVAEKAGGLIVVAGPVNMPEWTRLPRGHNAMDLIRRLYPVSFYSQGTAVLKLGRFGGDKPFPLNFTREGRAAEYLWIGHSSSDSQTKWAQFEGVFGYYAVNESKLGADILAYFADPNTLIDGRLPIYLASHFYGAGRVFFQASGEMWRVRRLDVEYFQNYYLKLVRWVSQGRLLRDSTQGVLLTDRQRCWMGDQIVVQAILCDLHDEPLELPNVEAVIALPDGSSKTIELGSTPGAVRGGTFSGRFTANMEGEYRIRLPIPDSPEFEVLTAAVQSSIPDLEKERPQRNDALLAELAEKTEGHYFVGLSAWDIDDDDPLSPSSLIQPQDQETILPGTPNGKFQRKLMLWLLILIVMCLSQEWTIRRLHKLA